MFNSCSSPSIKYHPDYKGINIELLPYEIEYQLLASKHGIKFYTDITIGFTSLRKDEKDLIIGQCNYGDDWREVDIDKNFWEKSSFLTKRALIFHELNHCHCERGHTYGKNADKSYPDSTFEKFIFTLTPIPKDKSERAYLDDGCPSSIMRPVIVDDSCMLHHFEYYIDEMFNHCIPF